MNLASPTTPLEWICLGVTLGWMLATAVLIYFMSRAGRVIRMRQEDEHERAELPDKRTRT